LPGKDDFQFMAGKSGEAGMTGSDKSVISLVGS